MRAMCCLTFGMFGLALMDATVAQPSAPFTAQDLVSLRRLTDPQLSPDARQVAYVLRETDLAANKGRTDLWLLDLTAQNAQPRRLASHEANDSSPRWAPDGRTI